MADVAEFLPYAQASTAKVCGLNLGRENLRNPYTGTFPQHFAAKSSCCGQPVRVARVLPPPVFSSSKDAAKSLPTLALNEAKKDAAASSGDSLELLVMQGKDKHKVVCRPDTSVECLKQQIEAAAGVMPAAQKLIFKVCRNRQALQHSLPPFRAQRHGVCVCVCVQGKQLKDGDSIAAAGLKSGDKLLVMISSEGIKALNEKQAASKRAIMGAKMEEKMALGADAANVMLLGANTWSCSPGICFLPRWVMDNLGVLDGDLVEIEPLQPPLNEEGHSVSRSLEPSKIQPGAVDSRSTACDLVLSNDWWCGQRIRDIGGTSFVCAPPNACLACAKLTPTPPPMHGALPQAAHVAWRVLLGPTAPSGDYEKFLENGPKQVLDALHLLCIQSGMNIPLKYPPVAGKDVSNGAPSAPSETLLIACESILYSEGKALLEACLTSRTEHSIECETDLRRPAVDAPGNVDAPAAPRKSGSQLWKMLAQAVRVKSLFLSSSDDALLMGEMVSSFFMMRC